MSNFENVFGRLPEEHQKEAILNSLEVMFAKGEWGIVEEVVEEALQISGQELFKAQACAIGIKCAIRLRNYEEAIQRYNHLSSFKGCSEIVSLKADTLYQLAISALPKKTPQIFGLWEALIFPDMPEAIQRSLAATGSLLAGAFEKNRDKEYATRVKIKLRECLTPELWGRYSSKSA